MQQELIDYLRAWFEANRGWQRRLQLAKSGKIFGYSSSHCERISLVPDILLDTARERRQILETVAALRRWRSSVQANR